MAGGIPRVAVVVATYRRPHVLRFALRSALAQTITDLEVLVVGDATGDDSAKVVADLDDHRVRFVDLAVGFGEQSGPNNVGVARTRAPLVAFLNHDDLWFPDHLATAIDTLDARRADLVFSPNLTVHPPSGVFDPGAVSVSVDSLSRKGRYDPTQIHRATPASSWVVRREVVDALGGWRPAHECVVEPSQDLLFRAHRRGLRLVSTGVATVVTVASGTRDGSYTGTVSGEHEWLAAHLGEPGFRATLLALDADAALVRREPGGARAAAGRRSAQVAVRLGLSPRALHYRWRRGLRAGEYLSELRRVRGLDPGGTEPTGDSAAAIRRAEVLRACDVADDGWISLASSGSGARHLAAGWSRPEPWGVWTEGMRAELLLRLPAPGQHALDLEVHPHLDASHPRQRCVVAVAGEEVATWLLDRSASTMLGIPFDARAGRPVSITFDLPDAFRPATADRRQLALGLTRMRVRPAGHE